ncbi:hypothetical protein ACLI4Z_09185 [Natrialbaceae archaeon A-arb3/5]
MRLTVKHESITIAIEDENVEREATVRISAGDAQIEVEGADGERATVLLNDDLTLAEE